MTLTAVGPVILDFHGDPAFAWASTADPSGIRQATIGGLLEWPQAKQLSELVANAARRVTIGAFTGVLEYIYAGDDLLRSFNGWYLLDTADLDAPQPSSVIRLVGVSVGAAYVGDGTNRQLVVARSARARANDYVSSRPLLVDPILSESSEQAWLVDPGGVELVREVDGAAYSPDGTPDPRDVVVRVGMFVGAAAVDSLPSVALVGQEHDVAFDGAAGPPLAVVRRGADVRCFDRREDREVFGPSHPFATSTDLVVTNGLLRLWVGPRGVVPYVSVAVFRDGVWLQVGALALAVGAGPMMQGVRLLRLTPEESTIALAVRGLGDVYLTLRRGERMIRVRHGSGRTPTVAAVRSLQWHGTPPPSHPEGTWGDPPSSAVVGRFDRGKSSSPGTAPGIWPWPPSQPKTEWTLALWWLPDGYSAIQQDSGIMSIFDTGYGMPMRLRWDAASTTVKVHLGAAVISTAPIVFGADDAVFLAVRLGPAGLALTVKVGAAAAQHVASAVVDPGTALAYAHIALVGWDGVTVWGDDDWGDGTWGGGVTPRGDLDNLMLFADRLTDLEAAALGEATVALGGLPSPEGRLTFYVPFDADIIATTDPVVNGTRSGFEGPGELTKALAGLTGVVAASADRLDIKSDDLVDVFDAAAIVALDADLDRVADQHAQFAADSSQETRIR